MRMETTVIPGEKVIQSQDNAERREEGIQYEMSGVWVGGLGGDSGTILHVQKCQVLCRIVGASVMNVT